MEIINKFNSIIQNKEEVLKKILLKHDFEKLVNYLEKDKEGFLYKINMNIDGVVYKLNPLDFILFNINNEKYPANSINIMNIYKYLINNTDLSYCYNNNYHNNDNTFYRITETIDKNPFYLKYLIENKSESLDIDPSIIINSNYKILDWLIKDKDLLLNILYKKPEILNYLDMNNKTIYSEVLKNLDGYIPEELSFIFNNISQTLLDSDYYKNEDNKKIKLIPELLKQLKEDNDKDKTKLILDTLFNRSDININIDFLPKEDLEYYLKTKSNNEIENNDNLNINLNNKGI